MYRLVQRHGKKILAVFSAFLMISFAASGMLTPGGGMGNPVIGRMDGQKIYGEEVFVARQDWQRLTQLSDGRGRSLAAALGPVVEEEINRNPILFLLLQKEAEKLGVTVSNDALQSVLTNTPGLMTTDPDRNDQIARAVRGLLLVAQSAQRAGSVVKITEPMVRHELAQLGQSITLNLADFTTAKYLDQAKQTEPTAEQLKAHFEKYADTVPGNPTEQNPFGFGYKYPDRVKLQYIVIPKSDVRKAVEASRTAYDWEVEARKYYRQNQQQFKAEPTTQASQSFDLSAPSTRPTTRPYEQVQGQIKDDLIDAETEKRMASIRDRLVSTMATDWVAYRNAVGADSTAPTTAPTTAAAPESSVGVPYTSFEYLQKLAQQVQQNKNFGVLPTAVSIADKWLTLDDLNQLPGIGQAHMNGVPVGSYIMSTALPFVPQAQREQGGWLRVMEPTRPMEDSNESIYIARVSAAEPSHKPVSIADVEQQLRADLLTARAYELAKADAMKLLEQARQKGLKDAAAGQAIVTAGPITNRPGQVIPSLALTGPAADRFVNRAFRLLSTGSTTRPAAAATTAAATTAPAAAKVVDLIELPRDGRVLVAELGDVQAMWTERSLPMEQAQIHMALGTRLMTRFLQDWFDYESVIARTRFVPEPGAEQVQGGTAPVPRPPPIL